MEACEVNGEYTGDLSMSYMVMGDPTTYSFDIYDGNECGYSSYTEFTCTPANDFITYSDTNLEVEIYTNDLDDYGIYSCRLDRVFEAASYGASANVRSYREIEIDISPCAPTITWPDFLDSY